MLNVGLIGLGPEWEHRYRPALTKLRHRLRVLSLHTPVAAHAEQVSSELRCQIAPGLMALVEREDVQALLVLDTAWYSGVPAQFACLVGKSAYLAGRLVPRLPLADQLLRRAAESGVTLMPDLGHRYTPATSRLRELIATRLGRPLAMIVDVAASTEQPADQNAPLPAASRELLAVTIDWCTNIVSTAPAVVRTTARTTMQASSDSDSASGLNVCLIEIQIEFRPPAAGGQATVACIRLNGASDPARVPAGSETSALAMQARVQCVKGTAWLEYSDQLTWESANEHASESLTSDRPDVEVMLDHFTRRVVGGLIPVPTLEDLCRAHRLIGAALNAQSGESPG